MTTGIAATLKKISSKRSGYWVVCLTISLGTIEGCVINFKSEKPKIGIIHVDVQYVYPGKNELNTIAGEGFYKKEIETGHYAQTKIELDPGQQLLILNKAIVLHFFDTPEYFSQRGKLVSPEPHSLRIHADTLDRTIHWEGSINSVMIDGNHADMQLEKYRPDLLMEYIDSIVKSTDEYQGLPAAK